MREIKFRAWDKLKKEWYGTSCPDQLVCYGYPQDRLEEAIGKCIEARVQNENLTNQLTNNAN